MYIAHVVRDLRVVVDIHGIRCCVDEVEPERTLPRGMKDFFGLRRIHYIALDVGVVAPQIHIAGIQHFVGVPFRTVGFDQDLHTVGIRRQGLDVVRGKIGRSFRIALIDPHAVGFNVHLGIGDYRATLQGVGRTIVFDSSPLGMTAPGPSRFSELKVSVLFQLDELIGVAVENGFCCVRREL